MTTEWMHKVLPVGSWVDMVSWLRSVPWQRVPLMKPIKSGGEEEDGEEEEGEAKRP
jgi:hypothetical protein